MTEPHINGNDDSTDSDPPHVIHRLGRLFEFLGASLLDGSAIVGQSNPIFHGMVTGLAADEGTAVTITKDGACQVFGATDGTSNHNVYFAWTHDYDNNLQLSTQDDQNYHLSINEVYLNWFSDGQQFQLNAGIPWGSAVDGQRSVFKVEDGLLKLVTGVWPADFPPTSIFI